MCILICDMYNVRNKRKYELYSQLCLFYSGELHAPQKIKDIRRKIKSHRRGGGDI